MFEVGQRLELFDVELSAVEALLHVFRIAIGVGKQILELNEVVLAALAFIEHFATAVDTFRTIFAGHGGTPL